MPRNSLPLSLPLRPLLAVVVLPMLLSACANTRPAPIEWRLQVRTTGDWADPSELTDRVAGVAGVPVKCGADAIAPHWYALTLQCEDRAACKRATMRLAAEPALFMELRRDELRQIPSRPSAISAQ